MPHVLVRGGDAERRGVVVSAEVCRHDPSPALLDQARQGDRTGFVEDRLWRLDHQLHAQRPRRQPMDGFDPREGVHEQPDLRALRDLRQRDDEVWRQLSAGVLEQPVEEQLRRPERTLS